MLGDGALGSLNCESGAKKGDDDNETELSVGESNGGGLAIGSGSVSCCGQGFEYLFKGVLTGGDLVAPRCASLEPSAWKKTDGFFGSGFLIVGSCFVASLA